MSDIALIFLFEKNNKYSINALLGALETKSYLDKVDIFLSNNKTIFKLLPDLFSKYKKIAIAYSFFTSQIEEVINCLKQIKARWSDIFFIAGGPHASGDPKSCLALGFDIAVKGEGEQTILDIVDYLNERMSLEKIGSIYYKGKGYINFTRQKKSVDLDEYSPFSVKFKRFGPIEITRGCPFGCFFCQTSYIFGKRPRHRSIDSILKAVEILYKRGMNDIRFVTPNAFSYGSLDGKNINFKKLEELLRGIRTIIKNNGRIFFGSFPSEVRPEHVNEQTIELVKKYANNNNLVIGCQSGSERILELCHRGHTVLDVFKAAKLCVKNKLIPKIDFIFGLPGEEQKDIDETIKVMEELTKIGAKIHAHTFMPLPGTPFSKMRTGDITPYFQFINHAKPRGLIFGEFESQKRMAEKIKGIIGRITYG